MVFRLIDIFPDIDPSDSNFQLLLVEMMYCIRLEDNLDGATNFRGMHLYISYIMRVFAGNVHLEKGHVSKQ
jgi:hypothetical protein